MFSVNQNSCYNRINANVESRDECTCKWNCRRVAKDEINVPIALGAFRDKEYQKQSSR